MNGPPPLRRVTLSSVCLVALFGLSGCADVSRDPLQPAPGVPILIQPALIPTPADADALPIHRIRTVAVRAADEFVLGESVTDVDPNADEWVLEVSVETPQVVTAVLYLYLVYVTEGGTELVQFSGRTDPITLDPDGEPITPEVTVVRGPLSNLGVTSVSVTASPEILLVGEGSDLAASAEYVGDAPTIFWTSTDDAVLRVDGDAASALSVGVVSLVASAGAFADTVEVTVLPADTIAPVLTSTLPVDGAEGVPVGTVVSVIYDEPIDPLSVNAATITLTDEAGAVVPATVAVAGNVASLTPTAVLDTVTTYTAELTVGARDPTGNESPTVLSWTFTTGTGAVLLSSFDPGLGTLVSIARDPGSGNLYVHDDFADSIYVFDPSGQRTGAVLTRPGRSSNDIDLDVLTVGATIGSTQVPAGTLLVDNGEAAPMTLFAIDPIEDVVLDSVVMQVAGNPVGGAYHPIRGTFFSVSWNNDLIYEVDAGTGEVLTSFPVVEAGSPAWDMFYGDLDVHPVTGELYLVSSNETSLRVMSPTGVWIRDVDWGPSGATSISGIAIDPDGPTAWLSSTNGTVYQVGGIG